MLQNFVHIATVPQYKDLIDIALSQTNRKTPTVVRAKFQIHRIRNFYVRKVRFTAGEFTARLTGIVSQFPILDDIHPFYSDLISILYDRDHYKIALSQISTVRHKIEIICKEHVKLINYGDTLYRCKELKRAALGKMATTIKKLAESLKYLEEVRQHMSRLPSIDPSGRSIVVCGFPNVGKSSFMNCVSEAHVEIQSYAFTTRSIFVGHFQYQNLKWQILDTPGLLDRQIEDRNSIEMLTITALAHLKSAVLFFIDLSESCGFSIDDQISLYQSLTPLLRARILIVLSKADISQLENICNEKITEFLKDKKYIEMSATTGYNVENTRNTICDMLLEERISEKIARIDEFAHRIKPIFVSGKYNERNEEVALGKNSFLGLHENESYFCDEKYDTIPEIYHGKNISDFIDPEIMEKIEILEKDGLGRGLERKYDILSKDERLLLEECNNARINANMRAHFMKRASMPAGWKNKITSKGEIVADIKKAVPVEKKEVEHVNKRVAKSENKRYYDMQSKHMLRPKGTKHGKLKKN